MIRFSVWCKKEVVNICDGRLLGCICDVEIDQCDGRILSLVVPGPYKFFGLMRGDSDYVIPWCKIRKIGEDVILVETDESCFCRCV